MSRELVIKLLLQSVVFPILAALVVGVAALLIRRAARRHHQTTGSVTLSAMTSAYLAGDIAMRGLPRWPPVEASQWLPWVAMSCLGIAVIAGFFKHRRSVSGMLGCLLLSICCLPMLRPLFQYTWKGLEVYAYPAGIALLLMASFVVWTAVASRVHRLTAHVIVACVTLSVSVLVGSTGSAMLGQLAGGMAVGGLVATALAWRNSTIFVGLSNCMMVVAVLGGLLVNAQFFSETPRWAALAILLAPGVSMVSRFGPIVRWKTHWREVIAVGAVALTCGLIVTFAAMSSLSPEPYRP